MYYANARLYIHLQAFVHMYVYTYIHKYSYIYLHISQNYLLTYDTPQHTLKLTTTICTYEYVYICTYTYKKNLQHVRCLTYALSPLHSLFPLNFSVCLPLTLFHGFSLEVCAPYHTLFNTLNYTHCNAPCHTH